MIAGTATPGRHRSPAPTVQQRHFHHPHQRNLAHARTTPPASLRTVLRVSFSDACRLALMVRRCHQRADFLQPPRTGIACVREVRPTSYNPLGQESRVSAKFRACVREVLVCPRSSCVREVLGRGLLVPDSFLRHPRSHPCSCVRLPTRFPCSCGAACALPQVPCWRDSRASGLPYLWRSPQAKSARSRHSRSTSPRAATPAESPRACSAVASWQRTSALPASACSAVRRP